MAGWNYQCVQERNERCEQETEMNVLASTEYATLLDVTPPQNDIEKWINVLVLNWLYEYMQPLDPTVL